MATRTYTKTSCRYYAHGACREGEDCKYSHDRSSKPSMVCRYYLKGLCTYGDSCRYDHVKSSPKLSTIGSMGESSSSSRSMGTLGAPKPIPLGSSPAQKTNMVSLKKGKAPEPSKKTTSVGKEPEEWVKAKEFVPGQRYEGAVPGSYAMAARGPQSYEELENVPPEGAEAIPLPGDPSQLCPFAIQSGFCKFEKCSYIHGEFCDICSLPVLHPLDLEQQKQHKVECTAAVERDMEHAFAVQRSMEKMCSICMELVMEKTPPCQRRFGIMPSCNHCFCLQCIREWRAKTDFDSDLVRSCPECRIKSDFVAPSNYWVDTEEEKKQLIEGYKKALSTKPCKYFMQGKGECPFHDKCFYQHAYPDGRPASPKPRHRRRRVNADDELDVFPGISLWDFIASREDSFEEFLEGIQMDLLELEESLYASLMS